MSGGTMRMTRYTKLPSGGRLDGSGIDPAATPLPAVNVDVTPTYHGLYVRLEEQVTLLRNDRVLSNAAARLGQSMRQTEDELTRDVLASTASATNCTGGANGDNPTEITRTDIDRVTTILRGNDAIFFEREVMGSNRFGSAPVRNAFFGLAHTDVIERLNNVVGYANSANYPNAYVPLESEEGAAGAIRFLVSSQGSISPNASGIGGADIYNIFVCGKKAVGNCKLDGYSTKYIYHPPRLNGPLELSHTAGYKLSWGGRILQDLHVQNLRCTL